MVFGIFVRIEQYIANERMATHDEVIRKTGWKIVFVNNVFLGNTSKQKDEVKKWFARTADWIILIMLEHIVKSFFWCDY